MTHLGISYFRDEAELRHGLQNSIVLVTGRQFVWAWCMSVYGTQVHVYKRWWQLASDFAPEYGGGVALCLRSCLRLLNSEGLAATQVRLNFPTPQCDTKNLNLYGNKYTGRRVYVQKNCLDH